MCGFYLIFLAAIKRFDMVDGGGTDGGDAVTLRVLWHVDLFLLTVERVEVKWFHFVVVHDAEQKTVLMSDHGRFSLSVSGCKFTKKFGIYKMFFAKADTA